MVNRIHLFTIKTFLDTPNGIWLIKMNFLSGHFKEIKQVRAYNVQSLIGNSGGYIGLFLGYTLKEMPSFLKIIYGFTMSWFDYTFGCNLKKY